MTHPILTALGSGKGGTGKTLVATSVASALSYRGLKVLLCDADLGLSNTTVHLGLESGGQLPLLLSGRMSLAEAVVRVQGGTEMRGGFDLVAAPAGCGAFANLDQSVAERLVTKLRSARNYDHVLLDLSAGVDATTLAFAAHSDRTVLVLTADPASLTDAYAFVKLLVRLGGDTPMALVNMSDSEAEARRTNEALAKTCRAFLDRAPVYIGAVPRDPLAVTAIRRQHPLLTLYPQAPSSRALELVARRLENSSSHQMLECVGQTR